jgi:hypothetical protein
LCIRIRPQTAQLKHSALFTAFWRHKLQLACRLILEAAFSVNDIRGLFAVAVDAILPFLGTFPK